MLPKFVDGRGEKWEGWIEQFLTFGWVRKQLDAGDFSFHSHGGKSVGLEAKSVEDLTSRLGDARRELAQLMDTVDIPILLIWGRWRRRSNDLLLGGQDQLTWGRLWGLLQTFQDSGLRVQLATSRDHAFLRINQLFAYYQREEHLSALVARRAEQDRRIAGLMAIPGISRKLGKALLDHFESLQAVASASESQLMQVSLVGPSRAKIIADYHQRTNPLH